MFIVKYLIHYTQNVHSVTIISVILGKINSKKFTIPTKLLQPLTVVGDFNF